MKLKLIRETVTKKSILGKLFVDENTLQQCYTLENLEKAIPVGTYLIKMDWSPRFQMLTPHLQDVPGRTFIEIHPANKPEDLEGCIGVGESQEEDWIGLSRVAFAKLLTLLKGEPNETFLEIA